MTPIGTPFMARCEPWVWRRMWNVTAGSIPARSLASPRGRFWWEAPQRSLSARVTELEDALAHVNRLERLLPICGRCKKIQSGEDWHDLEHFLASSAGVRFSHGACPVCAEQWLAEDGYKP